GPSTGSSTLALHDALPISPWLDRCAYSSLGGENHLTWGRPTITYPASGPSRGIAPTRPFGLTWGSPAPISPTEPLRRRRSAAAPRGAGASAGARSTLGSVGVRGRAEPPRDLEAQPRHGVRR